MKVRVYFCKESDPEIILNRSKISRQALDTIYDLVWEGEFKNIFNAGMIWIKFREEDHPFGISLKEKRSHYRISLGDLIQVDRELYFVNQIGVGKVDIID